MLLFLVFIDFLLLACFHVLEDLIGLLVDFIPVYLVVVLDVFGHIRDHLDELLAASIYVAFAWVRNNAQNMRRWILLLDVLPNSLPTCRTAGSELIEEVALVVVLLAFFDRCFNASDVDVLLLLCGCFVVFGSGAFLFFSVRVPFRFVEFIVAIIFELLFDFVFNVVRALRLEALENDHVLEVLNHLLVDGPQLVRALQP